MNNCFDIKIWNEIVRCYCNTYHNLTIINFFSINLHGYFNMIFFQRTLDEGNDPCLRGTLVDIFLHILFLS